MNQKPTLSKSNPKPLKPHHQDWVLLVIIFLFSTILVGGLGSLIVGLGISKNLKTPEEKFAFKYKERPITQKETGNWLLQINNPSLAILGSALDFVPLDQINIEIDYILLEKIVEITFYSLDLSEEENKKSTILSYLKESTSAPR